MPTLSRQQGAVVHRTCLSPHFMVLLRQRRAARRSSPPAPCEAP
jgi:hypothetical protein